MPMIDFLGRCLILALAALLLCKSPAAALDLFASHNVVVQFATPDGKPMANAEVKVYAPGDRTHPVKTGQTDKDGKFEFGTDRDGMWTAEARFGDEVAHVMIRVGNGSGKDEDGEISPYVILAGLGVLLVLAVGYRYLRIRARRQGRSARRP
jgi:nickel transport protein